MATLFSNQTQRCLARQHFKNYKNLLLVRSPRYLNIGNFYFLSTNNNSRGHYDKLIKHIPPGTTAADFEWSSFPVEYVPEMLYQLTKRRRSNMKVWTTNVFLALSRKLMEKPKAPFTNVEISKLFFGLNSMPERHPNVEDINNCLCHVLQHSYARVKYPWTSYNISCAMYYLRHHRCDKRHVRELIAVCAKLVGSLDTVDRPLTTVELGNILYGLQGLSSDTECVRTLLMVLLPHIQSCTVEVDGHFIADLFALQRLASDRLEVAALVEALSDKFAAHSVGDCVSFGPQHTPINIKAVQVCRALFGLQLMHMQHEPVRRLVRQLAPYLSLPVGSSAVTHPKDLALVLDGLRLMFTVSEARVAEFRAELTADDGDAGSGAAQGDRKEEATAAVAEVAETAVRQNQVSAQVVREEENLSLLLGILDAVGRFQLQTRYSSPLNTDQMSRLLYSFRGYSSRHSQVRRLVTSLMPFVCGPVVAVHQSSYTDSKLVTDMLSVHHSIRVAGGGGGGGSSFYRRVNRSNGNNATAASSSSVVAVSGAKLSSAVPSSSSAAASQIDGSAAIAKAAAAAGPSKFDAYQVAIIKQGLVGIRQLSIPTLAPTQGQAAAKQLELLQEVEKWNATVLELDRVLYAKGIPDAINLAVDSTEAKRVEP